MARTWPGQVPGVTGDGSRREAADLRPPSQCTGYGFVGGQCPPLRLRLSLVFIDTLAL